MVKSGGLVALAASAVLVSCDSLEIRGESRSLSVAASTPPALSSGTTQATGEDRHWIRDDEVFVVQYDGQAALSCFEVSIARVLEGPSEATRGEAKLFVVRTGKEVWSSHYWRTRLAERADLRLGTPVIFYKGPLTASRAHGAPPSKEAARPGGDAWFHGTISDDSELHKGVVKVADYDYALQEETIRVIVP